MTTAPCEVLNEVHRDGVVWQARRSADRGRLEVVGIVPASSTPVEIEPLTEPQLRALLEGLPTVDDDAWICSHCAAQNAAERRWCASCSSHEGAL